MSRSQRLFQLLQLLRRRRRPVAGAVLAAELGVSVRTLYRDIATLQTQGARIDGEPGVGYLLQPGFSLPPLMFSQDELQAISLGTEWVAESADPDLSRAARDVLAKIAAVVPESSRHSLYNSPLLVGPVRTPDREKRLLYGLRIAIQEGRKTAIQYTDAQGKETDRTIWPFGLAFFEDTRMVMAWCEKRSAIRHFRTDRITRLSRTDHPYPRTRDALLAEWRQHMEAVENVTFPDC